MVDSGWRRRIYPEALRTRMARSRGEWFKPTSDAQIARSNTRMVRLAQSGATLFFLLAIAAICAAADWTTASGSSTESAALVGPPRGLHANMISMMLGLVPLMALEVIGRSLNFHTANALPQDRTKLDWIKAILIPGGLTVGIIAAGALLAGPFVLGALADRGVFVPTVLFMLWPAMIAFQLLVLAFVVAIALSIFYRGAVDPRLAARKLTMLGVLGLGIAFVFILVERTVAQKIVEMFGLEPGTGAFVAGAVIAASIAPAKTRAEKFANVVVTRFLPLQSVARGERKVLTVAMSDLSGYTRLSSSDEAGAMLLAALLQRQAHKIASDHRGRVVKSMGDAVMFAFETPQHAVAALRRLHANFGPAAEQLGLVPLPVHSGAYTGEVTETADGDLYGQTVNLAARLQGMASPGECVLSQSLADAAGVRAEGLIDLGARQLKNVPEPVPCVQLVLAA